MSGAQLMQVSNEEALKAHRVHRVTRGGAVMFTTGLVVLVLVALSCGESGMSFEDSDQAFVESLNELQKIKTLVSEEVSVWPENYAEMSGLPEDDETAETESHATEEHSGSSVWKVVLVLAVLLLAVLGVLSTVYYLCIWRGGRMHYEQQKEVST